MISKHPTQTTSPNYLELQSDTITPKHTTDSAQTIDSAQTTSPNHSKHTIDSAQTTPPNYSKHTTDSAQIIPPNHSKHIANSTQTTSPKHSKQNYEKGLKPYTKNTEIEKPEKQLTNKQKD